jgi:hypothetical protein
VTRTDRHRYRSSSSIQAPSVDANGNFSRRVIDETHPSPDRSNLGRGGRYGRSTSLVAGGHERTPRNLRPYSSVTDVFPDTTQRYQAAWSEAGSGDDQVTETYYRPRCLSSCYIRCTPHFLEGFHAGADPGSMRLGSDLRQPAAGESCSTSHISWTQSKVLYDAWQQSEGSVAERRHLGTY